MGDEVTVVVNGEPRGVPRGTTVEGLLRGLGVPPEHAAVERNGEIVGRPAMSCVPLEEGDRLEVVRFVGGG